MLMVSMIFIGSVGLSDGPLRVCNAENPLDLRSRGFCFYGEAQPPRPSWLS